MEFLVWLQGIRMPALDYFMLITTYLGDQIVVIPVLCFLLWCGNRNFAIQLAFVFFFGGIVCQLLKLVFMVPRPWLLDPRIVPLEGAVPGATGWSFPSGHTASAVSLYGGIFLRTRRRAVKALCVVAILAVAFSRMYAGVHTPVDVMVSILVGVILLCITWIFMNRAQRKPSLYTGVVVAAAAMVAGLLLAVAVRYGEQPKDLLTDAVIAAGAAAGFLAGWWPLRKRALSVGKKPAEKAVVFAAGLVGIALLYMLYKLVGDGFVIAFSLYALLAAWAVAIFPMLAERVLRGRMA